jgi:hypothetical protein
MVVLRDKTPTAVPKILVAKVPGGSDEWRLKKVQNRK